MEKVNLFENRRAIVIVTVIGSNKETELIPKLMESSITWRQSPCVQDSDSGIEGCKTDGLVSPVFTNEVVDQTHFLFTNPLENRVSEKTVLRKFIVEKVDLLGFSDTKCQGVSGVWGFVPDRR